MLILCQKMPPFPYFRHKNFLYISKTVTCTKFLMPAIRYSIALKKLSEQIMGKVTKC